jgi:hypothetical protein
MTNEDWIQLFRMIPEEEHVKLVLVLASGTEITCDTIVRCDQKFLILRGRQGGTIDEARGFFVPYDQMLCVRLERPMKLEEITAIANNFSAPEQSKRPTPLPGSLPTAADLPLPPVVAAPTDAASASRMLMDRIRASRVAGSSVKNPSVT